MAKTEHSVCFIGHRKINDTPELRERLKSILTELIESDVCIFYYDEDYLPSRRRNSRRDLFDYQPKSGTAIAYDYALQKKKKIINCFLGKHG